MAKMPNIAFQIPVWVTRLSAQRAGRFRTRLVAARLRGKYGTSVIECVATRWYACSVPAVRSGPGVRCRPDPQWALWPLEEGYVPTEPVGLRVWPNKDCWIKGMATEGLLD